ncbi:Inner membrane ABC transporter permease protein ycjO [uncultured Roseburia sp.]|uniref:Sugar ABC transporter permease n=1 Tax=Brotonthovivens ammoniilytica TaxID=2981725 RepID=A0ABT2TJE0_9FIRM|nr:sugar ABC transporter permease [Brotonthovivens ammoniilytica]MCU6762338.1 sugar ABC transporter permease [Brotonthovivens ammoniilytica]SCI68472.1 Inner membrane ABC transporter permease protein ycjO [uncultured Roseburia sp.]
MKPQLKKFDLSKLTFLPAVIIVFIITQVPFGVTIVFSFLKWNVKRMDQGITFAGLKNYIYILGWDNFWRVLLNTVVLIVACLALCTVLAILLGVLFNRKFPGSYLFRTMLILPYFVMDCVVGIVWKTLILDPNMGMNYWICKLLGINSIDFFGRFSLLTIVILIVWQWTPFFFMIIIAGLQSLPTDVLESASLDGASAFQQLIHIKIPMIKNHIITAMTLGLINILKVFGLVYVTTSGGPGVNSANLPYLTYRTIFNDWNVGRAAALAVITVVITLVISQNFFKLTNKKESDYGRVKKPRRLKRKQEV